MATDRKATETRFSTRLNGRSNGAETVEKNVWHDKDGHFRPGNPGGGRKRAVTQYSYLKATVETCSVDDWQAIVRKAVENAKEGDSAAREFLARYLMGAPRHVSPTALDVATHEVIGNDLVEGRTGLVCNILKGIGCTAETVLNTLEGAEFTDEQAAAAEYAVPLLREIAQTPLRGQGNGEI